MQPTAPFQQQAQVANDHNVVYVNVNGTLQRAVLQNGSVYLLNGAFNPAVGQGQVQVQGHLQGYAAQQQQPMAIAVSAHQPGFMQASNSAATTMYHSQQQPVQPVLVQQVVAGAGARLVQGAQGTAVSGGMAPQQQMMMMQQPQPQLVQQQHVSRPMVTLAMPSTVGQPMMTVMPQGAATAGAATVLQAGGGSLVQPNVPVVLTAANAAAGGVTGMNAARVKSLQPVSGPPPVQHLVPRAPAARPVNLQGQLQPSATLLPQQQQQQQWRPPAGVGPVLVNGPVHANAVGQSNVVLAPLAAVGAQLPPASAANHGSGFALGSQALPVGAGSNQQQQQMMLVMPVSSASAAPAAHVSMVPANAPTSSGGWTAAVPFAPGGNASPPVPPTTPSMLAGGSVAALVDSAAGSLAVLPNGAAVAAGRLPPGGVADYASINGSTSPAGDVINSRCVSKDGSEVGRPPVSALSPAVVALSPAGSTVGSQPGTPARSYGVNSLYPGDANSTTSQAIGARQADDAAASGGSGDKAKVMRLLARSFVETGIALEQALTMIQPADRDLLAAAFGVEAKERSVGRPLDPAPAEEVKHGAQLSGLRDLGGVQVTLSQQTSKLLVLNSSLGPTPFPEDGSANSSTISLGSWGFSLFSSGDAQSALSGFDALSHTGRDNGAAKALGSEMAAFAHSSPAVTAVAPAPASPIKEFAMTSSMLAALNL
eukprot:gene11397-11545_t